MGGLIDRVQISSKIPLVISSAKHLLISCFVSLWNGCLLRFSNLLDWVIRYSGSDWVASPQITFHTIKSITLFAALWWKGGAFT